MIPRSKVLAYSISLALSLLRFSRKASTSFRISLYFSIVNLFSPFFIGIIVLQRRPTKERGIMSDTTLIAKDITVAIIRSTCKPLDIADDKAVKAVLRYTQNIFNDVLKMCTECKKGGFGW